jgi:hypothetical protein
MARVPLYALGAFAFATIVDSLIPQEPRATVTPVVDENGISPKPTISPELHNPEFRLLKKQAGISYDWFCGWWDDSLDSTSSL